MSGLFGKTKTAEVTPVAPLPPTPERSDEDTQALATEQRSKFFKRGGRASTMLTGGAGDATGASAAVSYLGGAART